MLARNNWLRIFVARGIGKKALLILVLSSLLLVGIALLVFTFFQNNKHIQKNDLTVYVSPTITKIPTLSPTIVPTATPSAIPTHVPLKMVFGIGSQAGPAMNFRIVKEAPVSMLSSWYNGTKDLEWMQVQKNDLIPRLYAHKYIVHLITWTDLPEESIQTSHGPACGRPYPVSTQVVDDMKVLAQTYAGNGPLYVTLFTEFQTYTCTDNNWIGNENYYNALKDNFRKIKEVFHTHAPQSKVAISWGGMASQI